MSTQNQVAREKYLRLMVDVEELEDAIDALEKQRSKPGADAALDAKLLDLQNQLGTMRTELTRVSDGCGTPHKC